MPNNYFNHSVNRISEGTKARGAQVNNIGDEIEAGFDALPDPADLAAGTGNYAADTGTANVYEVALPNTVASYTTGLDVTFKALNANTGASTLNVDGVGAAAIVLPDGTALSADMIAAGSIVHVRYDGTSFQMLSTAPALTTQAAASAAAAATSESNAATSEANAATSESNAATSESNALGSANAAALSESNAATSESNAAASASAASTSASNAATSESNAATSEANALTSENNAATSESNAATSEANAAASYDSFDDRYLGAKASDPALDNDGDPLIDGAIYFNTSVNEMRVYDLGNTTWIPFSTQALPRRESFTATSGQTTFTVTGGYSAGYIDVYLNGVKLVNGDDVTVTSETDVVLVSGASEGDVVDVVAYETVGLVDSTFTQDLHVTDGTSTVSVENAAGVGSVGTTSNHPLDVKVNNAQVAQWSALGLAVNKSISAFHPTNKNLIIGGDFTTNPWQRGTSFASPASNDYAADRFAFEWANTTGRVTITQDADNPTAAEAGVFTAHCLKIDVTTDDTSLASSDRAFLVHRIEGYTANRLGFGQAGTRYVTLSFWHKHTKTGSHAVTLINSAHNRSYVAEYTQSVTDTWEFAELTIPVDTSGTWLSDNGIGIEIRFAVAVGGSYGTANPGQWISAEAVGSTTTVNNFDSVSNNMQFALIQLEAGEVATTFESRDVATELALCQRYFHRYAANDKTSSTLCWVANGQCSSPTGWDVSAAHPVEMRDDPTITFNNATSMFVLGSGGGGVAVASVGALAPNYRNWRAQGAVSSGLTAGNATRLFMNGTAASTVNISVDAEL